MLHRLVVAATIFLVSSCAGLTPEQIAERRIARVKCEHDGGKMYGEINYGPLECVSAREQERLERLELACVQAGGTPIYNYGSKKYQNCNQRAPDSINVINNNTNTANSTIKRY